VHEISLLLTGFTAPDKPLVAKLDQMHDQLNRMESHAAETAESVRRVLQAVSTEVTDCPRLFTLAWAEPSHGKSLRFYKNHYRLTLWCEHSGYWHPWVAASYQLDQPKDWFTQISPYAVVIFRTLRLVVPLAGSVVDVLLSPDQLARAQSYLQLMNVLVADLPNKPDQDPAGLVQGEAFGKLTAPEGEALRALRAVLLEQDRLRVFGGLRRVLAPSGDFLWVCQDHYPEYDPGLPTVP
jgi:hypothetical protein